MKYTFNILFIYFSFLKIRKNNLASYPFVSNSRGFFKHTWTFLSRDTLADKWLVGDKK